MFKQKKLSRGARFGLSVASFVLGLLLFFTAIATALVADVQIVISKDGISGILRTMISAPAHVRPNAPITINPAGGLRVAPRIQRTYQMPNREEPGNVAANLTDQLIGMFYEQMGDMFGEEMTFTQEEFVEMVNGSTVKDYIVDKTASLITDYFNDEITTTFEPEEVVQLIHENSALIESITGQPIPDDIAEQVAKAFDENEIIVKVEKEGLAGFMDLLGSAGSGSVAPEEGSDITSSESGINVLNTARDALNTIAATKNLVIGIAICLVLMAGIILINCRQLGKGLRRAGYPLMFAGSMIVLNILAKFQPDMWVVTAGEGEVVSPAANLVLKLARHILLQTAVVNIVIFGTGFVLVVGGIVLGIVLRPKKSPVSVPTTPEAEELAAAVVDETPVEVLPEADAEEAPAEEMTEEVPVAEEIEEVPVQEETEETPAPIGE